MKINIINNNDKYDDKFIRLINERKKPYLSIF